MKQKIPFLIAGAFGGSFANLLAVAIDLTKDKPLPQPSFFLAVALFAALGAGVTAVFEETVLKKAFLLGVGLPSLLQVSIGNVTNEGQGAVKVQPRSGYHLLVMPAYAQAPPAVHGRTLEVTGIAETTPFAVVFLSGQQEVGRLAWIIKDQGTRVAVPDGATHYRIEVAGSPSTTEPLPSQPNAASTIRVGVEQDKWSGFLKGIGVRNVPEKSISIERVR